MKKNALIALLMYFVLLGANSHAQVVERETGYPFIHNYAPKEYNAHTQNFAIAKDSRNIMYFGNFAGVLEFDGNQWTLIPTEELSRAVSLATGPDGLIYVGGRAEFGFIAPNEKGTATFFSLSKSLKEDQKDFEDVISILVAKEGIYFVSSNRIFLMDSNKSFSIWNSDMAILSAFYADGKVYINQENVGLLVGDIKGFSLVKGSEFLAKASEVASVFKTKNGRMLVSSSNLALYEIKGGELVSLETDADPYLKHNRITCGAELPNGSLAFGTVTGGLVILSQEGELLKIVNARAGLRNEYITEIFASDNNELWLALNNGISKIHYPSPLTYLDESAGLVGGVISVGQKGNTTYFGTFQGLYYLDKEGLKKIDNFGYAVYDISIINNRVFLASSKGLAELSSGSIETISEDYLISLQSSQKDSSVLYCGLRDGILIYELANGQPQLLKKIEGIDHEVKEIVESSEGDLWLASPLDGLYRVINPLGNYKVERYGTKEGLPSEKGNHINTIDNQLFITTTEGIYSFKNGKFELAKELKIVSERQDYWRNKLIEDRQGNLWTNEGDESELTLLRKTGKLSFQEEVEIFLPISDFVVWTIFSGKDDIIWIGGPEGVLRFDEKLVESDSSKITALLRKISIGADSLVFDGMIGSEKGLKKQFENQVSYQINYDNNSISFTFSSPSYSIKEEIYFSYKLDGFDNTWSEWTKFNQKEYTNLSPGLYTFKVKAKNIYGQISEEATYSFEILRPWYMMWWFYLLLVLAFILLIILIVRWRGQIALKKQKELEDLIAARTQEVKAQNEELETQSEYISAKNDELEKINAIVKSINSELEFKSLLDSILEKTTAIKGVDSSLVLFFNKRTNCYEFLASNGRDLDNLKGISFTQAEAEYYFLKESSELSEDIFHKENLSLYKLDNGFERFTKPHSIIVVTVKEENSINGMFVFENINNKPPFDEADFSLITNLKEHIRSAFIKAEMLEEIAKEKDRSEDLLLNILPKSIAEELKDTGKAEPRNFDHVTVLFTDFKGFTNISETMTPKELINELNTCFLAFDEIITRHGMEKIKTIGDAYMCAGGVPNPDTNNHFYAVDAALEMQSFMKEWKEEKIRKGLAYWECRLGIHTGPCVAGVVGTKKFAYDIWGDTVNTASRMESSGEPGKVNISGTTYELVKDYYNCSFRGKIPAKNKGDIEMYFVESKK